MNWTLIVFSLLSSYSLLSQIPIPHAHSHNDYLQEYPLTTALENGFTSIEIDVYSKKKKIRVAHWPKRLNKKPTLENLYLIPLQQRISENQGTVFPGDSTSLILMIDLKINKAKLFTLLKKQFQKYEHLLKIEEGEKKKWGPLKIILSGNPPIDSLLADKDHYFSADGYLNNLNPNLPTSLQPRASMNFKKLISWKKGQPLSKEDQLKITGLVEVAHAKKIKTRFWAIPEDASLWKELLDLGVDWLNIDDLEKYHLFIVEQISK